MKRYLHPIMWGCAALGLLSLAVVIGTNSAYPSPVFQIGTLLGLGLLFLALLLLGVDWAAELGRAVQKRDFPEILYLLMAEAILLVAFFRR